MAEQTNLIVVSRSRWELYAALKRLDPKRHPAKVEAIERALRNLESERRAA